MSISVFVKYNNRTLAARGYEISGDDTQIKNIIKEAKGAYNGSKYAWQVSADTLKVLKEKFAVTARDMIVTFDDRGGAEINTKTGESIVDVSFSIEFMYPIGRSNMPTIKAKLTENRGESNTRRTRILAFTQQILAAAKTEYAKSDKDFAQWLTSFAKQSHQI